MWCCRLEGISRPDLRRVTTSSINLETLSKRQAAWQRYYAKNKEKLLHSKRLYVEQNKEKVQALKQQYYHRNKTEIQKYKGQYYNDNFSHISQRNSLYYIEHKKELSLYYAHKNRSRKEEVRGLLLANPAEAKVGRPEFLSFNLGRARKGPWDFFSRRMVQHY
jgi:hypothetical protein